MQSTDSETPARSVADTILSLGSSRATGLTAVEAKQRTNRSGLRLAAAAIVDDAFHS